MARPCPPLPPAPDAPFALALVGCGKAKARVACAARDLYTSALFRLSLAHAESQASRVRIVSALHGLVDPDEVLHPYALALGELTPEAQRSWTAEIAGQLGAGEGRSLLLLAGGTYALRLEGPLRAAGWRVELPLRGLSVGRRLRWLSQAQQAQQAQRAPRAQGGAR